MSICNRKCTCICASNRTSDSPRRLGQRNGTDTGGSWRNSGANIGQKTGSDLEVCTIYEWTVRRNDEEQEKTEILRESHRLKSECLHLSNELNQVKTNLNDLEQYTRRDCLEIRGIPIQTDREDTDEIVKKVGEMVGVSIESKDISTSHRLISVSTNIDREVHVKICQRWAVQS